ncbi:MAG: MFS transporter [Burkholderiales bacterium]|nr:MFS transporter [Burkholderiales bacterium]
MSAETTEKSQFALLGQRRFAPFFWTQFLGAGNDNVFKFAFTILVTFQAATFGGLDPKVAAFVIGAVFIAPFLIFSATAGQLADKLEKSVLIRAVKNLEIAIMLAAAAGFVLHSVWILYGCTFLMGLHSTLFGPVKYAYLPQHLREDELVGGNALIEMGTFVAILVGTMAGGALASIDGNGPLWVAVACVAVAVAGRIAAAGVPRSPAADPDLRVDPNPLRETLANLRLAARNRTVFLSMLGISWLWFVGATFLTSFSPFAKEVLGGNEGVVTLLLAVFSVGIGIGSLLCERMSGHKVEIGLVPFGSIGMSVFAIDMYFATRAMAPVGTVGIGAFLGQPGTWRVLFDLFMLAMFGGFYSVPLYALIQTRSEATHRARIIAANNILNAVFMIGSSLLAGILLARGLTIPQLFLVTALLNACVAAYIYTLVPEFLMRFLCWLLIHSVYRLRKTGIARIPEHGPALITCNHVSFVDALVIAAACPRPIRFVMDHNIFRVPVLSFFFRTGRAIPIAPAREDAALLERAYDEVARALEDGDLVAIFPEGRITDTGEMYPFRGGVERILARTPVPVVPMALSGLWGSFFSRRGGAAMTRPFRRGVFSAIGLAVGEVLAPQQVTREGLAALTRSLRGDWR